MLTGRQTLGEIDGGLRTVRAELKQLDLRVQETTAALAELHGHEVQRYRHLAQIQVDRLARGELIAGLEAAERQIQQLLARRRQALSEVNEEIEAAEQQLSEREAKREETSCRVEAAGEALDEAEARAQAALETNDEYRRQAELARLADETADHAEEKTQRSQQDREAKGKSYEADPLFSYLWERGFGTSAYSGGPLTRTMDRWVARLCRYEEARRNYARLTELPVRLREHAERTREAARDEVLALELLEEKAAADERVPELRTNLDHADTEVEQLDAGISEQEDLLRQLFESRAEFVAGKDEYFARCVDVLAAQLQRDPIDQLQRETEQTPNPEDDVIVQHLSELAQNEGELKETLERNRAIYDRHLQRLRELEQVRRQFKERRYDDYRSTFGGGTAIGMILEQVLGGMANGDDLWGTLQRQQRFRRRRSNPSFGSGRFPRYGGNSWRLPMPRGGGMGRGGSGGFRTGGSF